MPSYRVFKSTSTATATTPSISVSGGSQPESAIDRHQQGSFAGLSTTVHTPESRHIPAAERYARLRLSAEISAPQLPIDPFKALATYQTVSLMMTLRNNLLVFYHCLMSHHRRPMMLTPLWRLKNPNLEVVKM